MCVFESYRFLNIYLKKFDMNNKYNDMLTDPSYLTSEEEYEKERFKKYKVEPISAVNASYSISHKVFNEIKS